FVAVADIDVRGERLHVELDVPRRVRAVDDGEDSRRPRARAQRRDGKHERARRRDMADEERAGSRGHRAEEVVDRARRARLDLDVPRSRRGADAMPEDVVRSVFVRRRDDLVTRGELGRGGQEVDRGGRVGEEQASGRAPADVLGESCAGRGDELRVTTPEAEEFDRLALELALKPLVLLEDGSRARAERPVVEEDDSRIEEKEVPQTSAKWTVV